jgi:hypothetical protein
MIHDGNHIVSVLNKTEELQTRLQVLIIQNFKRDDDSRSATQAIYDGVLIKTLKTKPHVNFPGCQSSMCIVMHHSQEELI